MGREIKLGEWKKVRPLAHVRKGAPLHTGEIVTSPKGVYLNSRDLADKEGNVDPAVAAHYGLDPADVRPFVRADFAPVYQNDDGQAMLKAWAAECKTDPNTLLCSLILDDVGGSAYSEAMNRLRPRTDKQISNALGLLMQNFPGMSIAEIQAQLKRGAE